MHPAPGLLGHKAAPVDRQPLRHLAVSPMTIPTGQEHAARTLGRSVPALVARRPSPIRDRKRMYLETQLAPMHGMVRAAHLVRASAGYCGRFGRRAARLQAISTA